MRVPPLFISIALALLLLAVGGGWIVTWQNLSLKTQQLEQDSARWQSDRQSLESQLADATARAEQIAIVQSELNSTSSDLVAARAELGRAQATLSEWQGRLQEREAASQTAAGQLLAAQTRELALGRELEDLRTELRGLQMQMSQRMDEITRLRATSAGRGGDGAPTLPLRAQMRLSDGQPPELFLFNTGATTIRAFVLVETPQQPTPQLAYVTVPAGSPQTLGAAQGLQFKSGDTVRLESAAHAPLVLGVP